MFRVALLAVGRLKVGAERDLVERYLDRAAAAGRSQGLAIACREVEESRARRAADRMRDEAVALAAAAEPGSTLIVFDEGGRALDSGAFSALIASTRSAASAMTMVIGGADGLDPDFRHGASHAVAFGAMTWPHQLVRVMAAEQLYRAVTILAGHPYHRR